MSGSFCVTHGEFDAGYGGNCPRCASEADRVDYVAKRNTTPQQFAQKKQKMGRGWAICRNSATLATTDYEHIADEIVSALNAKYQEPRS